MKKFTRFAALASTLVGSVIVGGGYHSAYAQAPMAPPVQDTYNWHDVPVNQQVQVTRAVFDQGGYRLYASTGEMIVVPFDNQNLYVMRFGQTGGGMYFVNDGSTPTLYVPAGGYLENAGASGARWYPFPQNFHYTAPVYMGFAPSWNAYVGMGWYPGMVYYGGYWGYHPWHVGLSFSPLPGLFINIGGHPYYGWGAYHDYYNGHPYNRVYVSNFHSYNYGGVPHRPASFFVANHTRFVSSHTTVFNHTTVVNNHFGGGHPGSFGHPSSFNNGRAAARPFGGGAAHPAFGGGHPAGAIGGGHAAFGGGHPAGSFGGGHAAGAFGGGHSGGSFGGGHPAPAAGHGGGSFGSHGGGGDHGGGGHDHH